MSIELFIFSLTAFCGICFLCGFYIAKRIYKGSGMIWETICSKCHRVRHYRYPYIDNCPECGEKIKAYHQIFVGEHWK